MAHLTQVCLTYRDQRVDDVLDVDQGHHRRPLDRHHEVTPARRFADDEAAVCRGTARAASGPHDRRQADGAEVELGANAEVLTQ